MAMDQLIVGISGSRPRACCLTRRLLNRRPPCPWGQDGVSVQSNAELHSVTRNHDESIGPSTNSPQQAWRNCSSPSTPHIGDIADPHQNRRRQPTPHLPVGPLGPKGSSRGGIATRRQAGPQVGPQNGQKLERPTRNWGASRRQLPLRLPLRESGSSLLGA